MKHHPEQLEDEIYMGNSTVEGIMKSSWRTIRGGTVALCTDGNPVNDPNDDFKPWFIKVSEVEASIESERIADRPWSAERIRTLQPMIDERTVFVGGGGAEQAGDGNASTRSGAGSQNASLSHGDGGATPTPEKS